MGARAAVAAGTVVSAAIAGAWSYLAGPPAPPVRPGRDLPADYARLAAAPTGNGWELFAVVAVVCAVCLLVSGWRQRRRAGGDR
jgi:hypothetical protein